MADSSDPPSTGPRLSRQESLQEVEELQSVWHTLKDKPTSDDISYIEKETELYNGQILPSRSEILAWYLYDWAHSPMYNVGLGLVLPLLITELALQHGCENVTKYGCNLSNEPIGDESSSVIVYMGNWALKPSAFYQVCISFSGVMQAVAYITIGALADYSYYQYYLFRICTIIASIMPLAFFFCSNPSSYLFGGWWLAIQLCFFGLALIFYNAYLPQIVENHWIVRRELRANKSIETCYVKQQITDDMSQYGTACGYLGSLIMTIITVAIFAVSETTEYEQLNGYGFTNSETLTSFNEEWLKPVTQIQMRFDNTGLGLQQIQLIYKNMDIDGDIYGFQTNSEPLLTYMVQNSDYITSIQFWTTDSNSINAIRFVTQSGIQSNIFGANNTVIPDSIAISSENNFIFSGYIVYVNDNNYVTGMDITMLNESIGQFQSTIGMRLAMLLVFIWWNFFQLFVFKYSKRRDGPPLPLNNNVISFSIKQFYYAIKSATKYPNMFRYLLAWFCFSDGLNTLSVTAVLFATTEMDMSTFEAGLLVLEALFLGSFGGVLFLWFQRKIGWNAKQMLLLHIVIFICLCLYTMIGLIPGVPFGLVTKIEMYLYVFVFGCNWGSIQSYARSVFAYLVPIGKESQMFALYEITDKGSSWMGPLMVALITNIASIRYGMFYVTIFFAVAAPLLIWGVDLQIGMMQAGRWNETNKHESNNVVVSDEYNQTEMIKNNSSNENKIDNYHEPNIKIKVTSLDDEEEEAKRNENINDIAEELINQPVVPSDSNYDENVND